MRPARRISAAALGRPGDGDDDPLAGLPRLGDAVTLAVALQLVVDPVGHPQQRQLPEGRQVAGPEVVGERGVDPLGRVDVAVGHAAPQRLGGHVHQLDLVGGPHDLVGDRLPLAHARDALDDVVERLEVLDVDGRHDVDAGVEQGLHVPPALVVEAAGRVGVGQLVDQRDVRAAGEDGVEVHLGQRRPPVGDGQARDHRQVADLVGGLLPPVRLDEADDHVGAPLAPPPTFAEHGEGLAHAGRGAQVDPQRAPPRRRWRLGVRHRRQWWHSVGQDVALGPRRGERAAVGDHRPRRERPGLGLGHLTRWAQLDGPGERRRDAGHDLVGGVQPLLEGRALATMPSRTTSRGR